MKKRYLLLATLFAFCFKLSAQPNFTANDVIKPYDGVFRPGVNFDIYPGFTDQDLASLAAGVANVGVDGIGAKALRPSLPESFLEQYGYDIRLDAFKFYDSLGLKDNTLIVGFPSDAHRDQTFYCPTEQSTVFKNMYEPIWDNGENGTPVNDNNYMALYIWKLVNKYKNYVKFYEIWNEPGFDFTGNLGWRNPGDPVGNWWDRNPAPCEYKLRAPIFNYIRILRIAYEVIKTADPNAYVVTSGLGYASFMDAILRNTDNPDNGKVTAQYPFGAGAYIDGIGYHVYPHFDDALRAYNVQRGAFDYFRHSDAAGIDPARTKELYDAVLRKYGYDGLKYPKKNFIITEANLPRKQFGDYIGSNEAQKNWIIKAYINCVQNDIWQMHIFKIAEETTYDNAQREFDVMGLYQKFDAANKYGAKVNDEGIAYGTTSKILFGKKYDAAKTASLNLPSTIGGAAFKGTDGKYTYVIWAKTTVDLSEAASAVYSFPGGVTNAVLNRQDWNWFKTKTVVTTSTQNISLNATPIFLSEGTASNVCDNDTQPPVFSGCPLDITIATTGAAVTANWTVPTATDNCSTATVTSNYTQGATFNVGTTNILYTAVDAVGNKSTCTFNIIVALSQSCDNDVIPPIIIGCPQNIQLTTTTGTATATWTAPTATDNCGVPTLTSNYASGATFNNGITNVIYTATDAKGNKATCTFSVTVSAQTSGAVCKRFNGSNTNNLCGCDDSRNAPYGMFIESANVCPGSLYQAGTDVVFQMYNDGTASLRGTFNDATGQPVVADITLSGGTTTPPTASPYLILCQFGKPASVAAGWNYYTNLNGTLKFGTNAAVSVSRRNEAFQVGLGANGQNTDKLGASGAYLTSDGKKGDFKLVLSNEQTITCAGTGNPCDNDTIPPTFTACPQNIVLTTAAAAATATWVAPLATDNCGTPKVTSNYVAGASFNLGSTNVIYTAVDLKNNTGTCAFTVTVNSQSGGTANCKKYIGTNVLNYCGCSDSKLHPYGMFFETVITTCPGNLLYADQDITFQLNNDGTAKLKGTFRDSTWKPYIVDIIFSGGTTTPPTGASPNLFLCQTGKPVSVANGWQYFTSMTGTVKYNNNSALTISRRNEAAQVGIGANTQITDQLGLSAPFILSDGTKGDFKLNLVNEQIVACSNTTNCDNDTIPPVFNSCPANIVALTPGITANVTWVIPTATDNCSATVSLTGNYLSGSSFPFGNTTVKYIAADAKGNKGTCSFVVTVIQQSGSSGADLSVSLTSSLTSFKQYTPADFRITLKNLGTTAFTDVKVMLATPAGLVGGNTATASIGTWQIYCPGGVKCATWNIPTIAGGTTATLDVSYYVLDVAVPIVDTATLTASTPADTNTSNNQSSLTLTQALQPTEPAALLSQYQSVAIQKIVPNPTLDYTEMEIVSSEAQTVNFVFYNAVGVLIKTETRALEQGANRLHFDASELSTGIYFVSPVTKNYRVVPTKFVKM